MIKKLLFSVTKKDFKLDWFSGTGPGGQHKNKHQNCVRLHHPASGVIVTGQSSKERKSNKKEAFKNLVKHPKFKIWHSKAVHEALTGETLEDKVEQMMQPEHLKIETKEDGETWISMPILHGVPNTCHYDQEGQCHPGPGDNCTICGRKEKLHGRKDYARN